jgi:autotransporter-associated beta strand protein
MRNKKILTALVLAAICASPLTAQADDLPGYFDWRREVTTDRNSALTNSIVPAIRNQGNHQTCWTFGTLASYESNWNRQLRQAGITNTVAPNFSERYLAWLGYAESLDGDAATKVHYDVGPGLSNIYTKAPELIYDQGGMINNSTSGLVLHGAVLESAVPYATGLDMQGVDHLVAPSGLLHDVYGKMSGLLGVDTVSINKDIPYYKKMLQHQGVLFAGYRSLGNYETGILNLEITSGDHAIALVGWDDDYVITKDGKTYKGAWILRNSWGTNAGENGYFYISYYDVSLQDAASVQPELDSARYTTLSTWAPLGLSGSMSVGSTVSFASRLPSTASQLIKAVGVYVPQDGMQYTVSVRLRGTSPTNGNMVYTQSGIFGENGSAVYGGYRTIDMDKFVYLPNGEDYVVLVTLTDKDGKTTKLPVSIGTAGNGTSTEVIPVGVSYRYNNGAWVDTAVESGGTVGVLINGLGKNSEQANGGDFTVVSLNDYGAGGSSIYLGKANELYGTDALHPNRTTLSNMTVELTKGVTDSWYGGVISGEGTVTKIGNGLLALSGANTYTGATTVSEGELAVTQGLQNNVTVASGAAFSGTGTINGSLTGSGTITAGLTPTAAAIMGKTSADTVGTLHVTGNLNASALQVAAQGTSSSQITVDGTATLNNVALGLTDGSAPLAGKTYTWLTAGTVNGTATAAKTEVSPYINMSADATTYTVSRNNTPLGGLDGMTDSERSVGSAMNSRIMSAIQNDPNSAATAALNAVLYQNGTASRQFFQQNAAESRTQLLANSPLASLTTASLESRLDTASYTNHALTMGSGGMDAAKAAPVALDDTNHLWLKLFKGYDNHKGAGDLNAQTFGGVIGYDKAVNKATRVGWLVSGGLTHYSADSMDGDSKDWQLGAYIEHKNAGWDYSGLLSYGRNNYDLNRYAAGEKYNADYHANVWDIEARAKYPLSSTTERTWKVVPYGKLGYTHTSQESYDETGTGISAQHISDSSHSSVIGEVGVELGRQLGPDGGYRLALGYKRVLSGANPTLNGTFVGDTHPFTVQSENDRNFLTYSVAMHGKLGPQWSGQAELLER